MKDHDIVSQYNYDEFVPEKFERWENFEASPNLGESGPDFPLWTLEGEETRISQVWSRYLYTNVEFGSFT